MCSFDSAPFALTVAEVLSPSAISDQWEVPIRGMRWIDGCLNTIQIGLHALGSIWFTTYPLDGDALAV
jgi:hypothetical protein